MAITHELALEYKDSYAITCCRFEEGTIISSSNIEDPNLIPDLEDSGLIHIPKDCLKIGEVLGARLTKTVDALTPLTPDVLEGITELDSTDKIIEEEIKEEEPIQQPVPQLTNTGNIKIHIGEGKDINIEIPYSAVGSSLTQMDHALEKPEKSKDGKQEVTVEEKELRRLKKKYFKIDKVDFGNETKIDGTTLYIRNDICKDAVNSQKLVLDIEIDFITPERFNEFSNTIMDIQPIATKE